MKRISLNEAEANLPELIASIDQGEEPFIVITINGNPAAKIVPYEEETSRRIGLAEGRIPCLSSLDAFNSIP
ncbi:MAG: type II toxin-antitoxin system Phd/YefM family antitoxin [Clostridia bacterium]|nr:type II toxin-antitoxin system Phd/YefM family antitoxin [Clostridia bacterium]